jgi:hypothetical protein
LIKYGSNYVKTARSAPIFTKSSLVVEFEHRAGYLYARAQAQKDSLEISVGYWTDIATCCKENGFFHAAC